mgnify:FL=1
MTKFARNLTAAIIAIFIVVMMVLLASSTLREDNPLEGNLSSTLSKTPKNLEAMSLIPSDVYGKDYAAIGFICPGMKEDKVKEAQIDTKDITFEDGKVPEGKSYAVAISQSTEPFIEELDPEKVEVCEMINTQIKAMEQQGQSLDGGVPMVQGAQPLAFQRKDGTWKLVG